MNLKSLLLFTGILLLTSNTFLTHLSTISENVGKSKVLLPKYSFLNSKDETCLECEDFISNALNKYTIPTINKEFQHFLTCSRESVVNRHDSSVIDTVYTFSNPSNKIQIYRANQQDFIFVFDVTDSVFNLSGNVRPGMKKEAFLQKFHLTGIVNDKVKIFNSEGSMGFVFYFTNNRLKRINSYLYLD
jgi:hypothetical protein